MAESVFVNGILTSRPGVYAEVDASALGGGTVTAKVLALVGDFPEFKSATPTRFNTSASLAAAMPSYDGSLVAKLIYSPSNDPNVKGQPSAVYVVNAGTSTQAVLGLVDTVAGASAITVASRQYGTLGNTGTVSVVAGDASGDRVVTVTVNGVTETWTIASRALLTVNYTGTNNTTTTIDVRDSSATRLRIAQTKTAIASGDLTLATPSWKWGGVITFLASGAGDHTCTVTGVRADTGAEFTSIVEFSSSDTPTTNPLDAVPIASITALNWDPEATETLSVSGYAFDIDLTATQYRTVKDVFDHIDGYSGEGWSVAYVSPTVGSVASIYLDRLAAVSMQSAAKTMTADLYLAQQTIDRSALVSATLTALPTASAFGPLAVFSGVRALSGGTFTSGGKVTEAYTALRTTKVQIIAHLYTDLTSQQTLRSHCNYMAGLGLGERNGWAATPSLETKANIATRTALLNTKHIALAVQDPQVTDHTGAIVWTTPTNLAVMFAAMQASVPIATPLTRKLMNVLDVRTGASWDSDQDAEEMIGLGACILTTGELGLKVERSVTTYRTDSNPIWSEVSANESIYMSTYDLRVYLNSAIGQAGVAQTAKNIQALAKSRLRWQVANGYIKAFLSQSVTVEDLGSVFRVNAPIAAIEPVNFIIVRPEVIRIPTSA